MIDEEHCKCCGEYIGEDGGRICSCDTGSCKFCHGDNSILRGKNGKEKEE